MSNYAFGVDVGGTTCKLGFFDVSGTLLEKWEIKTRTQDHGSHILDDVVCAIEEKMAAAKLSKEDVLGIGIGVPSPVTADGIATGAANLGWVNYDVAGELSRKSGFPVKAGNDVNVATLGEQWMGSAAGYSNALMITLGTGVGGGVVVDNRIITGCTGSAGEIGHITVNKHEKQPCGCGRRGCLEQYASATGVVSMANKLLSKTAAPSHLRDFQPLTAKDVFDCAKSGDALAVQVVEKFGEILGSALSNIACILNPEIFVIGGGVSKAGQIIIDVVQKYFREKAFFCCTDTKFALASLGNDAGIYGAVSMLLR